MTGEDIRSKADAALLHAYNRFPVVLERGKGVYVYDTDGKKYLDFAAGIGVCGLGYAHPVYTKAMQHQLEKLIHTSNLFYTPVMASAAARLTKACGMDRVFFTNSGTEAVEGALKTARKYAVQKKSGKFEIIAMENAFHGRSLGALSVTGTPAYREPFEPLVPGVSFASFNDLASVKAKITERTCAVLVEPVQGEGGIHPANQDFLEGLRKLCDEQDILLIFDEIQCGMGRTGNLFVWQHFGVKPDILCMAKAIGNGMPVGAFALTEAVAAHSLVPGDHGTTYGGNPLAARAVDTVLSVFEEENLMAQVKETGAYFTKALEKIAEASDKVKERRGIGLMQGLALTVPVADVVRVCMEKGLLILSAGGNTLRMLPPLIITRDEIDQGLDIIRACL